MSYAFFVSVPICFSGDPEYARCDPLSKTKTREQFLYCQAFGRMEANGVITIRVVILVRYILDAWHSTTSAPPAEGVAIREEDSHTRAAAVEG